MNLDRTRLKEDIEIVQLFLTLPSDSLSQFAKTNDQITYFNESRLTNQAIYAYWYIEISKDHFNQEIPQKAQAFLDYFKDPLEHKILWTETRYFRTVWELVKIYISETTTLSNPVDIYKSQKDFFEKFIRDGADSDFLLRTGYCEDRIKDKESFIQDQAQYRELEAELHTEMAEIKYKLSSTEIDKIEAFYSKIGKIKDVRIKIRETKQLAKKIPKMENICEKLIKQVRLCEKITNRQEQYLKDCQRTKDNSYNPENDSWVEFGKLLCKQNLDTHPLYKKLKEIIMEGEKLEKTAQRKRPSNTWNERRSILWVNGVKKVGNKSGSYS